MLRNPTVKAYQRFYIRLFLLYRLAKRYQNDARLTVSRAAKVRELQQKILKLFTRCREEIVTEKQAEKNGWDMSCVTSESDTKLIRLQKELVKHLNRSSSADFP
jgi:hypothetical protein